MLAPPTSATNEIPAAVKRTVIVIEHLPDGGVVRHGETALTESR